MAVQRDKVIASAEKLVAKGKIEPAIKEYERLLEDNPNDVNTLNRIGDLWVRINRNDEAVKVFGKIADHYSRDGFFLKAIAIFKKINKLDPSKLDIYAKLADLYAKQGLAMEAKSQYQVLADYYLKHGDPSNALLIYRKISELDPNSINVHVKLADLYSQVNKTADALKEYDRVGRMLLKRGMLDEAVQVFRKALKIDPRNTELVDSLVTALLEAKDFENARLIVEGALEANREHPPLLAMLGRIHLGRGDLSAARVTLERATAADPNDPAARETLADLYLKQSDPDRAVEMMAPLVERFLGRGERNSAIELLNRILRVDQNHTPTLERLVAVYTRLNEETNILASMNSLAEAHIGKGTFAEGAKVLEKLIQREPQNAQHRTKLQFVRQQMGQAPTPPPMPALPRPSLEVEEPAPSFGLSGSEPELSFDLDSSPAMELDFSLETLPSAPKAPLQRLQPAIELAAADIAETTDDLDFITEHLTEAEVFAKYGLAEKATEHLRAVLERAPKNLTAHERLFRILLEEGDVEGGRAAANAYIALLEEKGDTGLVGAVQNEFLSRGHSFDVTRETPSTAYAPEPEAAIDFGTTPADEEMTFDLDNGAEELEFELEPPDAAEVLEDQPAPLSFQPVIEEPVIEDFPAEEPVIEEPPIEQPVVEDPVEDEPAIEDLVVEEPVVDEPVVSEAVIGPVGEDTSFEEQFARGFPTPHTELEELTFDEPLLFDEPVAEESSLPEPEPLTPATELQMDAADAEEEPFLGIEGLDLDDLPVEELGEIDFYIEQELFDEARRKLETLDGRFPGNVDISLRRERVESAAAAAIPSRPAVLSRAEIESELLSAIPDDDDITPASQPPAVAPDPTFSATMMQEENLFADEDSFFDLAAELESELADDEEPISLSEEEQSLEEIFKEFKKGVEQQLDSEDYDTHYNLGIAYKEMGLIDEAIGEFQLASKDPKRAVECASMLGLCFLEKGMPQLAIKWYRKGMEMPEISEDEHVGLLYDLGSAYQEVGDVEAAQKAFMEVYGMNSNYRDTVSRIKALEDSRR